MRNQTFAQKRPSSGEDVLNFVENYDHAWNHKDASAIERILAPDYVDVTSKGGIGSRPALIDELMSPAYKLASAERSEMKVYFAAGTAVVSSRWKGQGTYNGAEFHDDHRCSIARRAPDRAGGCSRSIAHTFGIREVRGFTKNYKIRRNFFGNECLIVSTYS